MHRIMTSSTAGPITRRNFCRAAIASTWAVAGLKRGTAAGAEKDIRNKIYPPGRYVDVHTHLGQVSNATAELTVMSLLGWMDANDIAQSVVLPLVSPEAATFPLSSDFVLAETRAHRDRLIPFCCLDPRASYRGGRAALPEILKRWVDQGARGFGEHKPGVAIDDPRNLELYSACGELKLPVLFHIDEQRNMDTPGLPGLEKAIRENPATVFIGHGPGWWASISGDVKQADLGGYPKGPVAPGGAIDRLMDKYANLFGDLSAGSGAGAIKRDPAFGREFLIRRADRLMFGTDYLAPGQEVGQLLLYRQLDLPAAVEAKIFRNNARKILRL